jgi:Holliday junction resolvase
MKFKGHNPKRDSSEKAIVDALRASGCAVVRLDQPVDLLILHRSTGTIALAECKTGNAKLNASQEQFLSEGWPVYVLRGAGDAVNMVLGFRRAA